MGCVALGSWENYSCGLLAIDYIACIILGGGGDASVYSLVYHRSDFNSEYLLIANCDFLLRFAINRFANINLHIYYSTVRGRPSQLLDS